MTTTAIQSVAAAIHMMRKPMGHLLAIRFPSG
jgi:hypothetical protein